MILSTNGARTAGICMQKHEPGSLLHIIYINWLKMHCRHATVKHLEKNAGVNLCDRGSGNGFLDVSPEAQTKGKNTSVGLFLN